MEKTAGERVEQLLNEVISADKDKAITALSSKFDASDTLAHHPFLTVRQEAIQAKETDPVEWRFFVTPLDFATAIVRLFEPDKELVLSGDRVELKKIRNKNQ